MFLFWFRFTQVVLDTGPLNRLLLLLLLLGVKSRDRYCCMHIFLSWPFLFGHIVVLMPFREITHKTSSCLCPLTAFLVLAERLAGKIVPEMMWDVKH